jgi:anti-anti-sigma factor
VTSFEIWKDHGVGLIEPDGALDMDTIPGLRQAFDEADQLAAHHTIAIIDGTVTIFDPAALGALLTQHQRLQDHGGTLVVVGATGLIARLLRRAGFGDSVPVFTTLDEALTALSGKSGP